MEVTFYQKKTSFKPSQKGHLSEPGTNEKDHQAIDLQNSLYQQPWPIHVWYINIFIYYIIYIYICMYITYIYHKNEGNVGKYTSPMAPMGQGSPSIFFSRDSRTNRTCHGMSVNGIKFNLCGCAFFSAFRLFFAGGKHVSYPSLPNTSWEGVLGMFLGSKYLQTQGVWKPRVRPVT